MALDGGSFVDLASLGAMVVQDVRAVVWGGVTWDGMGFVGVALGLLRRWEREVPWEREQE